MPEYAELARALVPEAFLVGGALAALGLDLFLGKPIGGRLRHRIAAAVAGLAVLAALAAVLLAGASGPAFGGVLTIDRLALGIRAAVLILTAFTLALLESDQGSHPAERIAIVLFAAAGFLLMAAAHELLLAFLALELASLSLYVLAGMDQTRPESTEAGIKYFLLGGTSTAFLLFGFSLLYGLAGSLDFGVIAERLSTSGPSPLLAVALTMVLVAFGFKAAAAPFHLWAPDVYQGAPAPAAALIASASKLAGFALFARLLWPGLGHAPGVGAGAAPVIGAIVVASLLVGTFGALAQSDLRRLLGYSAIAHSGALMLATLVAGASGPRPLFYYAVVYGLATSGIFGVIAIADRSGGCTRIADLAGLYRRSPLLAGCLFVFVLSLAGVPPLAGFFGKLFVFAAALRLGGLAHEPGQLAVLAILLSAVAFYYYLIVLKQALVLPPAKDAPAIPVPAPAAVALAAAALLLLVLGLAPSLAFSSIPL